MQPVELADKVIITAAITGAVHTPTMTPYLPITPKQIADEAVGAAEAGAAVVHIHVRDPGTGRPVADLSLFKDVLANIESRSNVIVNTTTGGGAGMTTEERLRVVPTFKPEMASFNMGSMNFGLHRSASKIAEWRFPWERPFLESTKDYIFKNTFADMERFSKTMNESGTKPELECYEVSHVYNTHRLLAEGILKAPLHIQFVMGIMGGIGAAAEDLVHLKQTADRLIGRGNYTWSVAAAGRYQFSMCVTGAILGGHVRVGLEDNLYLRKGVLAKSNAELVEKVMMLVSETTGRETATPDEAREIFGLKRKTKQVSSQLQPK